MNFYYNVKKNKNKKIYLRLIKRKRFKFVINKSINNLKISRIQKL